MKKDKKFEDEEKSIDDIFHSLNCMGDVTSEDEQNNRLIAQVLQKLPKKDREKVLDKVIFVHTTAYGTVELLYLQRDVEETEIQKIILEKVVEISKFFIILNFKCIRNDETKTNTIAHEIAHFILNPKNLKDLTRPENIEEKEADDLAEKWGFKRCYKRDFYGGEK